MIASIRLPALLVLTLGIAACSWGMERLPSGEVLRRAILRSRTLDSVTASAVLTVMIPGPSGLSGSAVVQGVIHDGGASWSVDASFQGVDGLGRPASGRARAVSTDGSQVFVRVDSAEGSAQQLLSPFLSEGVGVWTSIGEPVPATAPRSIPDPADLEAAVAMFVTAGEADIESSQNGSLYHIKTSLSPQALLLLFGKTGVPVTSGDLWVDDETFQLQRAHWIFTDVLTPAGRGNIQTDIRFSDFDNAPQVEAPTQ